MVSVLYMISTISMAVVHANDTNAIPGRKQ